MPVPASRSPSPSPLFTVGPVPSGAPYLGATTIATIPKGTLVVNERPLFTLDAPLQSFLFQRTVMAGAGGGPTPVEGEEDEAEVMARFEELHGRPFGLEDWMERAIRVLLMTKTEEERVAFDELAATQEGMELTNGWNIFTTNAISTTRDVGGLFLLLSRFNSSCRPNLSRPYWDPATKTITLYALYDIPPNTELVWPYLAQGFEFDSIPSRGGQLRHVFGFDCLCEGCALQGEAREASERRTKELRRLRDVRGGEREGSVEVVRRMGVLCGEEGLWEAEGRMKARVAELERVEREE